VDDGGVTAGTPAPADHRLDGAGGIVTADDGGTADIYAQRVNGSGVPQWTADGVAVCTAVGTVFQAQIVSDDAGGAIITWYDSRSGIGFDIYAQRLNSEGLPKWTVDGVGLCVAGNHQYNPALAPDGAGGAIVTWQDYRGGPTADIYAQRVDASGNPQ
jgi:hypothetical protein